MQKRFLRKAAFTLIMLLILVSASSALATTASNGFDYYKVSSTEYFAHGTDGTWWLLTDSGTFSKIR